MLRAGASVRRGLHWSALGLSALLAATALGSTADARGRHRHQEAAAEEYSALHCLHRGRRQFRRGDASDQRRQPCAILLR